MININKNLNTPVRSIGARVELLSGSTLIDTFAHTDRLKTIDIERVGEGKFFGFGICQRLNTHIIDENGELNLTTSNSLRVYFDDTNNFPDFNITEVHRDEVTNELSVTAYDAIYKAGEMLIVFEPPYTLADVAVKCAAELGLTAELPALPEFDLQYEEGANLEGTENIREILNAVAEATQTIYYINNSSKLVFKRLDKDGAPVFTIGKASYVELQSGDNRRLSAIMSTTQLGENYEATTSTIGSTQYIRDNPFWDLREDITTLVDNALAVMGGFTINQFDLSWRGNYALELGDKLGITLKNDAVVYSYLLDDVITYDGSFAEHTKWSYAENETETASNPTNLGDVIKLTYAKVDKANKQVEIMVSDVAENTEQISNLQLTTSGITATVGDINKDINNLSTRVSATMTSEEIQIAISDELENGVERVTTTTGFTFNEGGLKVTKADSEMSTQITDDGMSIYRGSKQVLTADNSGVKAEDLHATTFLIIGKNSRLEDYSSSRTGCFWIG